MLHGIIEFDLNKANDKRRGQVIECLNYDIGGVLFSLGEIDLCILKGKYKSNPSRYRRACRYGPLQNNRFNKNDHLRKSFQLFKFDYRLIFAVTKKKKKKKKREFSIKKRWKALFTFNIPHICIYTHFF